MAAKPFRVPKSFAGFMTPLHRLSPDQRLAEVAARTTGDSYRASLEAGWDFQMDAQTSAQAEAFANPGAVNLFTSAGIDAEITRRTKGPNQRDTLNAAWDVLAERDAAAEAMKQAGPLPPLSIVQPPAPIAPTRPDLTPPFPHVAFDPSIWTTAPPPVQPTGSFFDPKPITMPGRFDRQGRRPARHWRPSGTCSPSAARRPRP